MACFYRPVQHAPSGTVVIVAAPRCGTAYVLQSCLHLETVCSGRQLWQLLGGALSGDCAVQYSTVQYSLVQ